MSKTINDPEQVAAEIDNEGFGYWIQNYGEGTLRSEGADELADMTHTNNPTEQQVTPTSEEELREQVDALLEDYFRPHHDYIYNANSTNDFLDAAIHLIQQYGNTREIEGRIDELNNLSQDWHSLYTVHKEIDERLDELTKTKDTPHETS